MSAARQTLMRAFMRTLGSGTSAATASLASRHTSVRVRSVIPNRRDEDGQSSQRNGRAAQPIRGEHSPRSVPCALSTAEVGAATLRPTAWSDGPVQTGLNEDESQALAKRSIRTEAAGPSALVQWAARTPLASQSPAQSPMNLTLHSAVFFLM